MYVLYATVHLFPTGYLCQQKDLLFALRPFLRKENIQGRAPSGYRSTQNFETKLTTFFPTRFSLGQPFRESKLTGQDDKGWLLIKRVYINISSS